jgi:hypothetical protein
MIFDSHYFLTGETSAHAQRRERAEEREKERKIGSLPYGGTGSVARVHYDDSWKPSEILVEFPDCVPPKVYMQILTVRHDTLTGRLEVKNALTNSVVATVLSGRPRVGDIVVGVQHEAKYQKQQ